MDMFLDAKKTSIWKRQYQMNLPIQHTVSRQGDSSIIPIYKEDIQHYGDHRTIKLMSHTMM